MREPCLDLMMGTHTLWDEDRQSTHETLLKQQILGEADGVGRI